MGVSDSVLSNVASKELLIAMKLHSGRDPDLRDVTMISDSADWDAVAALSNRGTKQKVIDQLGKAIIRIKRPEFEQNLGAHFGSRKMEGKQISTALENISRVLATMN